MEISLCPPTPHAHTQTWVGMANMWTILLPRWNFEMLSSVQIETSRAAIKEKCNPERCTLICLLSLRGFALTSVCHTHVCHRQTFHLVGTAAAHHSCNLPDCPVLSRTHIVPFTPSSSSASLYICIVVCSHNDRIHSNADPAVLNNKGRQMRGRVVISVHVWMGRNLRWPRSVGY